MQSTQAEDGLRGMTIKRFQFCEEHGFRALVFDWDGVLLDSGRAYYYGYEKVLQEAGVSTTPREIYLREGQPTGQLLAHIFSERGIPVSEAKIREMVDRRREYQSAIGCGFFPEIWRLLTELRASGYKLGMVTGSSRRSVELVLTKQLESHFHVVITADDVHRPKPDPEPFRLAAERLNLHPAECLVIENAPFGIEAAQAAECGVIAICTTLPAGDLQSADWVVPDHRSLESWLSSAAHFQAALSGASLSGEQPASLKRREDGHD